MVVFYQIYFFVLALSLSVFAQIKELEEHIKEGEYEEIIDKLNTKALTQDLTNYELYLYARAKIGLLEFDEAEKILKKLLSEDPNNPHYRSSLSEIHLQKGNLKKAEETLKGVPDAPAKLYILGTLNLLRGRMDFARSYFTMLPKDSSYYYDARGIKESIETIITELLIRAGYDSNPTVSPQSPFIARKESPSYNFNGSISYNGWNTSFNIDLNYTTYDKVRNFNTFTGAFSGEYIAGRIFVPFMGDYVTVGGNFYRVTGSAGIGFFIKDLKVRVLAGYHDYYKSNIKEENRDGPRFSAGVEVPLNSGNTLARIGLNTGYEDTSGINWKSLYVQPYIAGGYESGMVSILLNGVFTYYSFQRENTVFGRKREDSFIALEPVIRLKIFRYLFGEVRYSFTQNSSNIRSFSYIRHTIYAGIGGSF